MSRVPLIVIVSAACFAGGWLIGAPRDQHAGAPAPSSMAVPRAAPGTIKRAPVSATLRPGDYDVADPSATLRRVLEQDDGLNEFRVRELVLRRAFAAATPGARANAMEAVATMPQHFPSTFAAEVWQSLDPRRRDPTKRGAEFLCGIHRGK